MKNILYGLIIVGLLAAIADLSDVNDAVEEVDLFGEALGFDASVGSGLYVVILGAVVAIAGSIATIAKRRMWAPTT